MTRRPSQRRPEAAATAPSRRRWIRWLADPPVDRDGLDRDARRRRSLPAPW